MVAIENLRVEFILGTDIRTRSRIREFEKLVLSHHLYELDFSNVEFFSRSFADELISFIDTHEEVVRCVNLKDNLQRLLEIVRTTRNMPRNEMANKHVVLLEDMHQVNAFFDSI